MRFIDIDATQITGATVFLDVDGTLVPDKGDALVSGAKAVLAALAVHNDVYLVSNGEAERTKRMAEAAGVSALPKMRKPLPHKALNSIRHRERVVVIGDKFLTDGLFAAGIDAEFIQVEHHRHATDALSAQVSYAIDSIASYLLPFVFLARPRQWIKNLLVFAPLFFAGGILVPGQLAAGCSAFVAFCLAASAVYALNDIFDREADREHPTKRRRPIASGQVTPKGACVFIALLAFAEVGLLALYPSLVLPVVLYALWNGAYTAWFKHVAVIDILSVAAFYIIRIVAGGAVTHTPLSSWIILFTFFGALFVITGKRRAEFRHEVKRKVLAAYSRESLDFMLVASVTLGIITYGLYSVLGHPNHPELVYSAAFVVLAVFRIMNRMYTHPHEAESPETLLYKDRVVLLTLVAWAAYVFGVFYLGL